MADNCSTFLLAMGILGKSKSNSEFERYLSDNNIEFLKIPIRSAWVGACWERQIKTIKSCLHKAFGRKHYEYFELVTIVSEIQNSINSRPLTFRDNSDHSFEVLTPNSFLKFQPGRALVLDSLAGTELSVPTRKELVSSIGAREEVMQRFIDLWHTDYLLSLRERGLELSDPDWTNLVRLGEVVLIYDPQRPRPLWQLGRIVELLPGSDDVVRFVKVLRGDKTTSTHPIKHLYPLEISSETPKEMRGDHNTENENPVVERPRRKAAIKCLEKLAHNF